MIQTRYFTLPTEYVEQFHQSCVVFSSIESHIHELSQSRYAIFNSTAFAILRADTDEKLKLRGVVPALSQITTVLQEELFSKDQLSFSRTMFYYKDFVVSQYVDINQNHEEYPFQLSVDWITFTDIVRHYTGKADLLPPNFVQNGGVLIQNPLMK